MAQLRGKVSYGQFLDGLEETGVAKEKILRFLKADPDGNGSIQDQVTAEMTTELMKVMGIAGNQTAQEVKRIRDQRRERVRVDERFRRSWPLRSTCL